MNDYHDFLESKRLIVPNAGIDVAAEALHPALFPFQRDLVRWALRKGRGAIWADTGLGKTLMQLSWSQHAADRVLILAPLAVAQQTVREGDRWGIDVTYARSQEAAAPAGITITNYEMADRFDAAAFGAVVLDESSILKSHDGKTRTRLIAQFRHTPMRLCCTATPAPNDIAELANHAEFLGILTRAEMLASFFVHDDEGWRLKGHAREPFYRWLASWGMSVKRPSDLGYSDSGYDLPPLSIEPVIVPVDYMPPGQLFFTELKGITDRARVRKETVDVRVAAARELIYGQIITAEDVHAGVVRKESEPCSGLSGTNKRSSECKAEGALCGGCCSPGENQVAGEGNWSEQDAAPTQGAAVRLDGGRFRTDGERGMRDMWSASDVQSGNDHACGSRPPNGNGSRDALPAVQLGDRPYAGRSDHLDGSRGVPVASGEPWIVWCGTDLEHRALERACGDTAISVFGSLPAEEKERRLAAWLDGEMPILISKVSIAGYGLNLQRCARIIFVGLSDSYEAYYQAIRRCWRYGQQRPVTAYIVLTEPEEAIYQNVLRKEQEAEAMGRALVKHVAHFEREEIGHGRQHDKYEPTVPMQAPAWLQGVAA